MRLVAVPGVRVAWRTYRAGMNCPQEDAVPEDAVAGWALVYPHLAYQDPVAAIAWLSKAFGFRERVRMEPKPGK